MNFKFISLCLSGLLICGCDNAASETPKSAAHANDAELADFVKKLSQSWSSLRAANSRWATLALSITKNISSWS